MAALTPENYACIGLWAPALSLAAVSEDMIFISFINKADGRLRIVKDIKNNKLTRILFRDRN